MRTITRNGQKSQNVDIQKPPRCWRTRAAGTPKSTIGFLQESSTWYHLRSAVSNQALFLYPFFRRCVWRLQSCHPAITAAGFMLARMIPGNACGSPLPGRTENAWSRTMIIMQRSGHSTSSTLRQIYTHTLQDQSQKETERILNGFKEIEGWRPFWSISCHISCHIPIKKAVFCDTKPVFYPSFLKLETIKKPAFSTFLRNYAENTDFWKFCGWQESNLQDLYNNPLK